MQKNKKCIIYTRVSSKEQLLENYSIEAQTKYCEEYAQQLGFSEIKYMGGIAESAKNEKRETYKAMLNYAMDKRNSIDAVIVYSIDRFSRHLPTAAPDIERLRKKEVILYSVHEGINSKDEMGLLLMHFKLSNSQFENNLRAARAKAGVKSRVLLGEYPFATPPVGYYKDSNKRLIVNEDGELLRKAFRMLLDGYTLTQMMNEMSKYGLVIKLNRWGEIVRNPIYAGLIVSEANENKPVKGIHEPIVPEKDFKLLQDILSGKSKPRLKETETIEALPLKTMLLCPRCHDKLTGDIKKSKKNKPAYYKCNKCSFTASAQKANNAFLNLLSVVEFNQVFKDELRGILDTVFDDTFREMIAKNNKLVKEITQKENQLINLLDDKYAEKISINKFETLHEKYTQALEKMQNELAFITTELPDKVTFIEDCVRNFSDFPKLWEIAEYKDKQQIFNTVFKQKPSIINNNHKIGLSDINLNQAFRSNLAKLAEKKPIIVGNY
jgi:site-specific DNA recombinase